MFHLLHRLREQCTQGKACLQSTLWGRPVRGADLLRLPCALSSSLKSTRWAMCKSQHILNTDPFMQHWSVPTADYNGMTKLTLLLTCSLRWWVWKKGRAVSWPTLSLAQHLGRAWNKPSALGPFLVGRTRTAWAALRVESLLCFIRTQSQN